MGTSGSHISVTHITWFSSKCNGSSRGKPSAWFYVEMLIPCKKGDQILNSCVVVASIELVQVKCGVRGDVGPACNVVGYLDRSLLGINHLYQHPVYQRTPVRYLCLPNSLFSINCPAWCSRSWLDTPAKHAVDISTIRKSHWHLLIFEHFGGQDCSMKSPDYGSLPPGAPNWCRAPFDPEGILRWVLVQQWHS